MSTEPNRLERRAAQRFESHQPVAIHIDGKTIYGFTQDLSNRGIFFFIEAETAISCGSIQGAMVDLTFTMPAEITLGESMPVRCRGRVLRSLDYDSGANKRGGVAVRLESYQYLPDHEPVTPFARVATSADAISSATS